jgi:hypothetical protein
MSQQTLSSESLRTNSALNLASSKRLHKGSRACVESCPNAISFHHPIEHRSALQFKHPLCIIGIPRLSHCNHAFDICTIPFYHGTWSSWSHRYHNFHDLMMLVLSCHAHVFCRSIIRIALRLLLSSVAMFCIWATCHRYFFSRCNVDPVSCMLNGWYRHRSVDCSLHGFTTSPL